MLHMVEFDLVFSTVCTTGKHHITTTDSNNHSVGT